MSKEPKNQTIELTVQLNELPREIASQAVINELEDPWENEGGAVLPDEKELKTPDVPLRNGHLYRVTGQALAIETGRYVCKITLEPAGRPKKNHRPAFHLP